MSGTDAVGAVLLDTCAVIWLANGDPLAPVALAAIVAAGLAGGVYVSPVSAWEIGMLSRSRRGRERGPQFLPDPKTWFSRVMAGPGIRPAALTPEIAVDASYLLGELHGDPGDRLLIATARHLGLPIVTRDRRIVEYAGAGWVRVIAC
jgi:PIN domain nuclease of toxin-antitoxin system